MLPMAWFGSCFPGGVAIRFLFPVLFVLQADSVAFYSDYPTWSVCFENTVLTWVVCGLLWIGAPFYWLYLWRRDLDIMKTSVIAYCRRSSLNIAKLVINFAAHQPKVGYTFCCCFFFNDFYQTNYLNIYRTDLP